MRIRLAAVTLMAWLTTSVYTVAMAQSPRGGGGWGGGSGGGSSGGGGSGSVPGSGTSAPEIDGPGGIAAIALLVSVGMIAYNRYRRKQ